MAQAAVSPDLIERKRQARALAFEQRAAAHREADGIGLALARYGLPVAAKPPAVVSGFHPYATEIDVLPLLGRLIGEGWTAALPVVVAKGQPLVFRAWTPGAPLVAGVWGIKVPPPDAPEVLPDVLLVPLLAFDRQGHRLGYGGGFYDRTLAKLRALKPVVAVGVAYAGQEVPRVPKGAGDEPLDAVLTERGPVLLHAN